MSESEQPAVITAHFTDLRLNRPRMVAQLIFEIPIEKTVEVLNIFGVPTGGHNGSWVAIAKLDEENVERE